MMVSMLSPQATTPPRNNIRCPNFEDASKKSLSLSFATDPLFPVNDFDHNSDFFLLIAHCQHTNQTATTTSILRADSDRHSEIRPTTQKSVICKSVGSRTLKLILKIFPCPSHVVVGRSIGHANQALASRNTFHSPLPTVKV